MLKEETNPIDVKVSSTNIFTSEKQTVTVTSREDSLHGLVTSLLNGTSKQVEALLLADGASITIKPLIKDDRETPKVPETPDYVGNFTDVLPAVDRAYSVYRSAVETVFQCPLEEFWSDRAEIPFDDIAICAEYGSAEVSSYFHRKYPSSSRFKGYRTVLWFLREKAGLKVMSLSSWKEQVKDSITVLKTYRCFALHKNKSGNFVISSSVFPFSFGNGLSVSDVFFLPRTSSRLKEVDVSPFLSESQKRSVVQRSQYRADIKDVAYKVWISTGKSSRAGLSGTTKLTDFDYSGKSFSSDDLLHLTSNSTGVL